MARPATIQTRVPPKAPYLGKLCIRSIHLVEGNRIDQSQSRHVTGIINKPASND